MQAATFVRRLQQVAGEAAVADVLSQLTHPAGRNPAPEVAARSNWFNGLSPTDRVQVEAIIAEAARAALFGMLCALDGSRALVDQDENGVVELRYRDGSQDVLLGSTSAQSKAAPLHDLL
ncbi:MAG TPA: hypothetical protein VNZ85_11180 [Caulobacter sp.]|nr:hypothetical protein [Caulobacter sp.]